MTGTTGWTIVTGWTTGTDIMMRNNRKKSWNSKKKERLGYIHNRKKKKNKTFYPI